MAATLVLGASGAIGLALVHALLREYPNNRLIAVSRTAISQLPAKAIGLNADLSEPESWQTLTAALSPYAPFSTIVMATGMLHKGDIQPEKSIQQLNLLQLTSTFEVNTFMPAMALHYLSPMLSSKERALFAFLSARVGSISDNRLGGWYSYRMSKAALNMMIKTAAIELKRRNANSIVVGLHPGTVKSALSAPFQANVPSDKLFSPEQSANYLMDVMKHLTPEKSGRCFAWDGQEIAP